ncbi:ChaN family lipoprotein [Palleronia caenipelagi]|uniref:ChaN family lipoprotein n=1 Tax=Palleronia caenipelagi TaxID=2489174 RepID=A0A547Q7F2_9RHOB|nr:ChaN family lipoprotein [Palleronia caenipelagi]TRD22304.1 ChaN family lipoprotein [Palleronia caenipelagi]
MRWFIAILSALILIAVGPLPEADIYVLGEEHDAPAHHDNQAAWVRDLGPTAVVFEMVPPDLGAVATERQGDPAAELGKALRWEERGWPDFATYDPIFKAAAGARIYGAELDGDSLNAAMTNGAATVADEPSLFGLDEPLPSDQLDARKELQDAAHCGLLPKDLLSGMVEAQRLRDAALAGTALSAFAETGGPVVVITGSGHARSDWGVPALIRRAAPDLAVISVGQSTAPNPDAPTDIVVITDPPESRQGDPCNALR